MLKTEDWILPSVSISISSFSAVGKIMAVLMQSRWPGFTFDPSSPSYLFSLVLRVAGKETTWMSLLASVYILPKVTGTNWHILRSRNQGKIRISWKNKYTLMSAGPGLVVGAVKQLQNPSRFFSTLLCPLHWWNLTACIIILSDRMILRQMNRIIQYICTMKGTIKMFKSWSSKDPKNWDSLP